MKKEFFDNENHNRGYELEDGRKIYYARRFGRGCGRGTQVWADVENGMWYRSIGEAEDKIFGRPIDNKVSIMYY